MCRRRYNEIRAMDFYLRHVSSNITQAMSIDHSCVDRMPNATTPVCDQCRSFPPMKPKTAVSLFVFFVVVDWEIRKDCNTNVDVFSISTCSASCRSIWQ